MSNYTATDTLDTLVKDVDVLKRNVLRLAHDVQDHAGGHADQTVKQVTSATRLALQQAKAHPFALLGVGLALGLFFSVGQKLIRA